MSVNTIATFPTLAELTSDQIVDVAQAAGEPEWLVERRRTAWEFFAQAAPPEWRRTDLTKLKPEEISPSAEPQGTQLVWDEAAAEQGVVFTTLREALHTHSDLISAKLGTVIEAQSHKFAALRAALWQDGVFVYVPRNVEVELPLQARYTFADGSRSIFPRTLIVLEANARVTFVEDFASPDAAQTVLAMPVTEIFAGPGSDIRFVTAQHWGANVYHIGGQMVVLDRDANCEWTTFSLGGQVQHVEAEARLVGNGSRVNWYGATFANKNQLLVTAPWLRHVGDHAESFMQFKTVVTDESYSVFDGMIKIEHESHETSTRLEEHALHLSPKARNDSIPGLKIDTNDVAKGGHASTSGDVDEMQLFYMQSRGISKADAVRMIVMGFFEPALNAVPREDLREELTAIIEAKI